MPAPQYATGFAAVDVVGSASAPATGDRIAAGSIFNVQIHATKVG